MLDGPVSYLPYLTVRSAATLKGSDHQHVQTTACRMPSETYVGVTHKCSHQAVAARM